MNFGKINRQLKQELAWTTPELKSKPIDWPPKTASQEGQITNFYLDTPFDQDTPNDLCYIEGTIFPEKEDWDKELIEEELQETQQKLKKYFDDMAEWTRTINDPQLLQHTEEELEVLEKSVEEAMARSFEYDALIHNLKVKTNKNNATPARRYINERTPLKQSYLQSRSDK